jgi:aryl-alcohol dehydrogenase-like predicted oxidoreductase
MRSADGAMLDLVNHRGRRSSAARLGLPTWAASGRQTMEFVTLSGTDLTVSPLCLGAANFGSTVSGDAVDAVLSAFFDAGGTLVDTAHVYAIWRPEGAGCSERELGAALRRLGAWDRVVLATKGGHPAGPSYPRPERYLAPEVLARDIDDSLERLGCERIDLYWLHRDDPGAPVDEVIAALNHEVERGRVRYLGASNWSTERIGAANAYAREHGLQGFVASQPQWSLAVPTWTPGPDPTVRYATAEDARWYADHGVAVVPYSATAEGWFGGKAPRSFDTPDNHRRRERAERLAAELGCTPTQVALAWLLHQAPQVVPIFSTSRPEHVDEAMGAPAVVLTAEQVAWLRG